MSYSTSKGTFRAPKVTFSLYVPFPKFCQEPIVLSSPVPPFKSSKVPSELNIIQHCTSLSPNHSLSSGL